MQADGNVKRTINVPPVPPQSERTGVAVVRFAGTPLRTVHWPSRDGDYGYDVYCGTKVCVFGQAAPIRFCGWVCRGGGGGGEGGCASTSERGGQVEVQLPCSCQLLARSQPVCEHAARAAPAASPRPA